MFVIVLRVVIVGLLLVPAFAAIVGAAMAVFWMFDTIARHAEEMV